MFDVSRSIYINTDYFTEYRIRLSSVERLDEVRVGNTWSILMQSSWLLDSLRTDGRNVLFKAPIEPRLGKIRRNKHARDANHSFMLSPCHTLGTNPLYYYTPLHTSSKEFISQWFLDYSRNLLVFGTIVDGLSVNKYVLCQLAKEHN